MKNINFKALTVLVPVGIAVTLLTLIFLPLGLTAVFKISNLELNASPSVMALRLSICIYACAAPYLMALFKLKSVCKLLVSENPFDRKIAKEFNNISICAFSEVVVFALATLLSVFLFNLYLYAFTILSLIIVTFISVTAGFLFKVIASVFQRAAEIKEDIDLTF